MKLDNNVKEKNKILNLWIKQIIMLLGTYTIAKNGINQNLKSRIQMIFT